MAFDQGGAREEGVVPRDGLKLILRQWRDLDRAFDCVLGSQRSKEAESRGSVGRSMREDATGEREGREGAIGEVPCRLGINTHET
jgi:hypothetical protein